MSGMASPAAGSPSATGGGIDGAQLAMRMVEAAERAAEAAQAASAAANAASSSSRPLVKSIEWYKMLPKPPNFAPQSREEELSMFREWVWQLEQYLPSSGCQFWTGIGRCLWQFGHEV